MDGLECKEVCKSELERTLRIDSEFYSKNYVEIYNMLSSLDPLNDEWQVIFKNSYHVLKQVVDQNIWRLKQLKRLPSASQAAAEKDYNREPPPDIDWPTDEEAKFTWFYYEMLKLNKDGARVLLKGKIDFIEHHYETECTVRWNESLSETAIKNASITRVVESQEKELAAAI